MFILQQPNVKALAYLADEDGQVLRACGKLVERSTGRIGRPL